MSTIRPLATIAILAVVGVFLAQQINDPPAGDESALANWGEAADASSDAPPAFDPNAAEASPSDAGLVTGAPPIGAADFSQTSAPAGDALPAPLGTGPVAVDPSAIPPLPPTAPTGDPLADLPLPSNIPTADYNGGSPVTGANTPSLSPSGVDGSSVGVADSTPIVPVPAPVTSALPPVATATGTGPTTSLPPAPPESPAASTAFAYPGTGATTPLPRTAPVGGYATAKPAIDAALARNELPRALLMLSGWRGDPTLSATERQQIDTLLGQLAGSVIYSNQHLLEGPYTVKPGETLQTIAQNYNVPWELLGKINGVGNPLAVAPGQTIKVVRGPFRATVDLSDNELFLTLDGRYAGRFPVTLDGAAANEGSWRVEQKDSAAGKRLVLSGSAGASYGQQIQIGSATPPASRSAAPTQGRIAIADREMSDLYDILSVGSEVTVRR